MLITVELRKSFFYTLFVLFALLCSNTVLIAQTDSTLNQNAPKEETLISGDTLVADSISTDSVSTSKKNSIEHVIKYSAKDSIRFDVTSQNVFLYGGVQENDSIGAAHVDYGEIAMDAARVTINWSQSTLASTYMLNDSTGKKMGIPILNDGGDKYRADTMKYNYNTKRAFISEILTRQNDVWVSGQKVLKDENDILYIEDGKFCPCEEHDAGTYFKGKMIKVIPKKKDEEGKDIPGKVVSGPLLLHIADLPTPIGLPFGIFPITNKRSSGVLIPVYGESPRGFYLRNGGFYWATNEYMDMKFTGEIYSDGGWGIKYVNNYAKKYRFTGNALLNYRRITLFRHEKEEQLRQEYVFKWSHTPKTFGAKRFTASVDMSSTTYYQSYSLNSEDRLRPSTNSSIRYSQPIKGTPFSMSMNFRHNQINRTGVTTMNLPDFNLSMNRQYPFRFKNKSGQRKSSVVRDFYESVNIGYSSNAQVELNNQIRSANYPFEVRNSYPDTTLAVNYQNAGLLLERASTGINHRIPIAATVSTKIGNFTGSFNYNEYWFPKSLDFTYFAPDSTIGEQGGVQIDTLGFGRSFRYSTGVSYSARIYGLYKAAKPGKRKAQLRHILNPRIGYSFQPAASHEGGPFANDFRTIRFNDSTEQVVSRFHGMNNAPRASIKSSSVSFGLTNILEMKYTPVNDTSGKARYIKILENLSANSSLNLAKEEFKMANVSLNANTKLLEKVVLTASATLDPYHYEESDGVMKRKNVFALRARGVPGSITFYQIALNTNLNPAAIDKYLENTRLNQELQNHLDVNYELGYVDFSIPWSLGMRYNYRVTRPIVAEQKAVQTFTFNGSLNLTDLWQVGFNAAYDFTNRKVIQPNVSISRDLGCWYARFAWVPFGGVTNFQFTINVKSSMLSDVLRLQRQNSPYDN